MKEIIIVEGKSDTNRLKQVYPNIVTFETSGLGLDEEKLSKLRKLSTDYKLIVFTDPDRAGEKIRKLLSDNLENLYHAYLPNDKAISKDNKSVGVEHASTAAIEKALANLYSINKTNIEYDITDLITYNVYNNKNMRLLFCNKLNIAFGNNKKVLNQLNNFNISREIVEQVVSEINETGK